MRHRGGWFLDRLSALTRCLGINWLRLSREIWRRSSDVGCRGHFRRCLAPDADRRPPGDHSRLVVIGVGTDGVLTIAELLLDLEDPGAVTANHHFTERLLIKEQKDANVGIADAGQRDLAAVGTDVLIVELADLDRWLRPLQWRSILIRNDRLGLARNGLGLRRSRLLLRCGRLWRGLLLRHNRLARLADGHIDRLLSGQALRSVWRHGAKRQRMVALGQRLVEHDAPGALLIDLGLGDRVSAALQRDGPAGLGAARDHALARRLDAHDIEARN